METQSCPSILGWKDNSGARKWDGLGWDRDCFTGTNSGSMGHRSSVSLALVGMKSLVSVANLDSCLLKLMQENAALNVETLNLHIGEYDWGEIPSEIPVSEADVILAADCVYFEVSSPHFFKWQYELTNTASISLASTDIMRPRTCRQRS